ncbi:MAG: ATP synthase F0 subunit B [Acidobacteriota bacterium]
MQINLTPDPSLLAIMVIFILNYLIVRRFFLQPVNDVLEAREQETRSSDEVYERSLAKFNEATAQMENQLHAAKRDAAHVREGFRGEAATHRTAVVERTQAEAKGLIAEADARLSSDVKTAQAKIVNESESLASFAAERILGRAV